MQTDDYKRSLAELDTDELTALLRTIRTSRAIPKKSNKVRKTKAEGQGSKSKPVTKNQMLNLINGMSAEDTAKLLASMMQED